MTHPQFDFALLERLGSELFENKRLYRDMFREVLKTNHPRINDHVNDVIGRSKQFLRQDRIVWVLRWERICIARELGLHQLERRWLDAMNVESDEEEDFIDLRNSWSHYTAYLNPTSVNYNLAMDSVVWKKQSPREILTILGAAEEDKAKRNDGTTIPHASDIHENAELVLKVPGTNWEWWNLHSHKCEWESDAMGHCGRGGYDSSLISLRENVGDRQRPLLTFTINKGGFLVEMKGRANSKPASKYHGAIVALLRNDLVVSLASGGYLSENNFSLDDLDDDVKEQLLQEKPILKGPLALWKKEGLTPKVEDFIDKWMSGNSYPDIVGFQHIGKDQDGENVVVLETWHDFSDLSYQLGDTVFDEYHDFMKNEYSGGPPHPSPEEMAQHGENLLFLAANLLGTTLGSAHFILMDDGRIDLVSDVESWLRSVEEEGEFAKHDWMASGWTGTSDECVDDVWEDMDFDPKIVRLVHPSRAEDDDEDDLNEMRTLAGVK